MHFILLMFPVITQHTQWFKKLSDITNFLNQHKKDILFRLIRKPQPIQHICSHIALNDSDNLQLFHINSNLYRFNKQAHVMKVLFHNSYAAVSIN